MTNTQQIKFSLKISRWTSQQNVLYLRFLKRNANKINQKSNKKFLKFKKMAQQIQTKTPNQCRSHHQKIMNKYKTIENIINGVIPEAQILQISQIIGENMINSQQQTLKKLQVEQISTDIDLLGDKINTLQNSKFECELDENIFDVLYDEMNLKN